MDQFIGCQMKEDRLETFSKKHPEFVRSIMAAYGYDIDPVKATPVARAAGPRPVYPQKSAAKRRNTQLIRELLLSNPEIDSVDLRRSIFRSAFYYSEYRGNITRARIDTGINAQEVSQVARRQRRLEKAPSNNALRKTLLQYLRAHPLAKRKDLASHPNLNLALNRCFQGHILDARRAAGTIPDPEKYITGAETARILGISRERVSQFYRRGQIPGIKQVKRLFLLKSAVLERAARNHVMKKQRG